MNFFQLKTLSSFLLLTCATAFAGQASAAVVTFGVGPIPPATTIPPGAIPQMPTTVYGQANATPIVGACPTAGPTGCYQEDGIVVGIVSEPTDPSSHYHRAGTAADRALQYAPDSSGVYVRMADLSTFSLTSFDYQTPLASGGNFVIYGYNKAINDGLLTGNAGTDPDWGTVAPIASLTFADDGSSRTLNVAALNSAFNNIGAFWIHYEGYPHSPLTNYLLNPPADFDLRLDNIKLAAVPVPGAIWLFGSGLAGLLASRPRKAPL